MPLGELPKPKGQHWEKGTGRFQAKDEGGEMLPACAAKTQSDGRVKVTVRKEIGGQHRDFHTQHLPQMRFK